MAGKMKVVQMSGAGGQFLVADRPMPEPGPGTVRLKIEACGICHSDSFVKEGLWPGQVPPSVGKEGGKPNRFSRSPVFSR